MEKTREELLEVISDIEKTLYFGDIAEAADAARYMAESNDRYAMQTFLIGLSRRLNEINHRRIEAWSKAYHAINDDQPEAVNAADEVDTAPIEELKELEEVTEDDMTAVREEAGDD